MSSYFPGKVKVTYKDLLAAGVVNSRYDLHQKIKTGKLRKPNKAGETMQAKADWWADELDEDIERERNSAKAAELEAAK